MKIIKQPYNWVGVIITCKHCDCKFEIENNNEVNYAQYSIDVFVVCPLCKISNELNTKDAK